MESLQELLLKEKIMLLELETLKQKILLKQLQQTLTVSNEPEDESLKSKASPEQTVSGKDLSNPLMDVAFPKSKERVNDSTKTESSTPSQTANGKESTNPLNPVALGKSKMVTLSPHKMVEQKFEPNGYKQALESNLVDAWYVIYDGKHAGIYTSWGEVHAKVKGTSTTYKGFKTLKHAQQSAENYDREIGTNIIFKEPKVQKKEYKRAKPYIKIKEPTHEKVIEEEEGISHEDFRTTWMKARKISFEDYKTDNVLTDDKVTRSLYIFTKNADAKMVYQAFQSGLVKNIYPSPNLQELRCFPEGIIKAIKNFRTKFLKASDRPMYINITSSIPDWSSSVKHNPYHFIEIGLAKEKEFSPSKVMNDNYPPFEEMVKFRVLGLKLVAQKVIDIKEDDQIKVNYCSDQCLITSWYPSKISQEDLFEITKFEDAFSNNTINVSTLTRQGFCEEAKKLFLEHKCSICKYSNTEDEGTSVTPIYVSGEESGDDFATEGQNYFSG